MLRRKNYKNSINNYMEEIGSNNISRRTRLINQSWINYYSSWFFFKGYMIILNISVFIPYLMFYF